MQSDIFSAALADAASELSDKQIYAFLFRVLDKRKFIGNFGFFGKIVYLFK